MGTDDRIDALFDRLDAWRHLPAYQLERRTDVFFSLYLKGVLEEVLHTRLREEIIPEFPLPQSLVLQGNKKQLSFKVDFVLFAHDLSKIFFVELKTDLSSRSPEQDHYLNEAPKLGFRELVKGITKIATVTKHTQKYHHLLASLAKLGFLTMPEGIEEYVFPKPRRGLRERLEAVTFSGLNPAIKIVYVQPVAETGLISIDFATFAAHVERFSDPLSQRFAKSLREWTDKAGKRAP